MFIFSYINPLDNIEEHCIIDVYEVGTQYHFNIVEPSGRKRVKKMPITPFLTTQIQQFNITLIK